jgi:TRAP-type mannitol/chloroaromatic compound transport system permease small subunit
MSKQIVNGINHINRSVGQTVSWLSVVLVVFMVGDVLLRYLFNYTTSASFELEWHLFACIFMLSAGWALQKDRHVRVDVFYHRFSPKAKGWVNFLGTILLLLPFCLVAIYGSLPFVKASFLFRETSPDPGGLPARFIIKSVIPIGFFLLLLQGIGLLISSWAMIKGDEKMKQNE